MDISNFAINFVESAEKELSDVFNKIDRNEFNNQKRVLEAFQNEGIALRHFAPTNGYGYDDIGRDTLDKVFAHSLECEDALVRPQIVSGTHSIFIALSGLLEYGDTMLAITGKPYDTLEGAIGINGDNYGSLKRQGIKYKQVDLINDKINIDDVIKELKGDSSIKVVYLQRSRGYSWRNALLPEDMAEVFNVIKKQWNDKIIVVDNCYGEFTCEHEPSYYGADIIIGSLIKNPGGGIAPTGGYVAGKHEYIEMIAQKLTVPGIGREAGSYYGNYTPFYQGLFLAPHVTAQSLKSAALFARIFEKANMTTMPSSTAKRSDIVQSLRFSSAEALIEFCRSIQAASPIDSFVSPEPWDMPGYSHQVIMAAGAFVQGASIELSADAPIVEPYTVYVQGALTYSHGKIGAMAALDALIKSGEINIDELSQ